MSHDATNWAIKQRGIKPALKFVLWHLCDRHHPDHGCFPSQETLAADCELPRSTLNVYLGELEEAGLILREQRRKPGSQRQERTRYYFPFEDDFEARKAQKPCPETGHGQAEAESRNEAEPSPEIAESRVQNLDSNLVREPVSETVNVRESASEREGEDAKAIERAFKRWCPTWPTYVDDSEREARKAWLALSADDRLRAAERTADYLAAVKATGRSHVCAASKYLSEKRWEKLGPPASAPPPRPQVCKPFSKGWSARRLVEFAKPRRPLPAMGAYAQMIADQRDEDGKPTPAALREIAVHVTKHGWPEVKSLHDAAREGRGCTVSAELLAQSDYFRSVHVDSPEGHAWRRLHDRHAMEWPDMGRAEWICFPPLDATDRQDATLDAACERALTEFWDKGRERRGDDHAA